MNIGKQIKDKIKLDNLTNVENINNNILNHINDFILDIISIPFTFENNKHIIDDIFNKYENEIYLIILKNINYFWFRFLFYIFNNSN